MPVHTKVCNPKNNTRNWPVHPESANVIASGPFSDRHALTYRRMFLAQAVMNHSRSHAGCAVSPLSAVAAGRMAALYRLLISPQPLSASCSSREHMCACVCITAAAPVPTLQFAPSAPPRLPRPRALRGGAATCVPAPGDSGPEAEHVPLPTGGSDSDDAEARRRPEQPWQTHDLSTFEAMLKDAPADADVWGAYGHALLSGRGDHAGAMQAYRRAIELSPSHSFALNNLGYILMKHRGDLAGAEGCFRKALQVVPADVNTNVNLAVLLSAHRQPPDYDTAAECYERALAVDDSHLGVLVNYANFLVERPLPSLDAEAAKAAAAAGATNHSGGEDLQASALRALRKAAREEGGGAEWPDGPVLRERLKEEGGGGGYTWEELTQEVPRIEEKAAETAITYWIAKVQDWKAANFYYERALELHPDSADAMCGYACLKRHENDAQAAESLYERAIAANPAHFEARSQYGLMLHKQNLLERARDQYTQALAINPQDAATCQHLAALLEMVHAPVQEIVRLYKQILILQPSRADIYHSLGRVLQEPGKDMEGAKLMFEFALDYNPRDVSSLNSLALISQYQGEQVAAQMYLQKAIRLAPDQHALHCNYAAFLQRERKEYDTAEEHYERALLLKPNHLQTLCCYGSFLRTVREDPQEALVLLRQALHLAPDMDEVRKSVAAVERELTM
eukprot:Tamp_07619.p1 GENE.Tamp_07619~~Tamp_07619.p1  ORF type:complete len:682 (+),score=130.54 Tamp_07619:234-2279(+)